MGRTSAAEADEKEYECPLNSGHSPTPATAAFVVSSRRNPLWAIGSGTCVSVAALHLGWLHCN
jgi:hypothetical protein